MTRTTTTRSRPLMAAAIATATAAAMLAGAPAALARDNGLPAEPTSSDRIAGEDRYVTAALLALDGYGAAGAPTAIVATGLDFPDALAANYLAGQLDEGEGGPILLTAPDSVPGVTLEALDELGVERVLLMGGTGAISTAVQQRLAADYDVERIAGDSRFETAAAIAQRGTEVGELDGLRTALLASGMDFPDAMVGGSVAFAGELPLLLTRPAVLDPATASALTDLQVEQVVIVGGTMAVNEAVEAQLVATGFTTRRVSGGDRAGTAAELARLAVDELGFDLTRVNLATGAAFPDALTGGPNAGRVFFASPVLLTQLGGTADGTGEQKLGAQATRFLTENCAFSTAVRVYGGPSAVSEPTAEAARAAVRSCAVAF